MSCAISMNPLSTAKVGTNNETANLPLDLAALEALAERAMSPMAWNYVRGGASDEITLRDNRAAFDRILLKPHVLCDISEFDTVITDDGIDDAELSELRDRCDEVLLARINR